MFFHSAYPPPGEDAPYDTQTLYDINSPQTQYVTQVQLGSNKQVVYLLIDTGSSWTWTNTCGDKGDRLGPLKGKLTDEESITKAEEACKNVFDMSLSTTATCEELVKTINYVNLSVRGRVCHDLVGVLDR